VATIDRAQIDALRARARREVDEGLLPATQVALAKDGELVLFESFGAANPETRFNVFSCTKAFVAGAAWLLIGEGQLDVSLRVADLIPEFAENSKGEVTVEEVMLHTSGFPSAPMGADAWSTREGRLQRFAEWRLNWEPGTRYEYHPTSAHWVLAELIERLSGRDYRDVVHERIVTPLGLGHGHRLLGVPEDDQADIAELRSVGAPPSPDELEATFGLRELPVTEVTDENLLRFNQPSYRAVGVPGGGGVMTAADLALYYQALLSNPDGLWKPDVLADVTSRVRNSLPDQLTGTPANRSLGLILAGDDGKSSLRGLGKTVSPGAFGHGGAGGQLSWADPATGLSLGYCTSGLDAHMLRQARRGVALSSIAATAAS
jgi:CubicO group peptidase (beta-lactamase class C family)